MRGRKPRPQPAALASTGLASLPRCPDHLSSTARKEWRRLAKPLFEAGVLTLADRGVLAGYCQAYSRWAEAERKLAETPMLIKAPSGYIQQSPWLSIANKQLELMGRFMAEMGLTPTARARLPGMADPATGPNNIVRVVIVPAGQEDHVQERDLVDDTTPDPQLISVNDSFGD